MKIVKVDEPVTIDAGPGTPPPTEAEPDYVDQIDNGHASVVSPKGEARVVALADLPKGVKEGHYVSGGQIVPAPADDAAPIRARLAAGDAGGPISLDDGTPPPPTAIVPPGTAVDAVSGGSPAGAAPGAAPGAASPGADAYIDSVIKGTDQAPGAPGAESTPTIPKLGPNGLPADSSDLQQKINESTAAEEKALQGESDAKAAGVDAVAAAQADRDELRRQQAADLAAEQLYQRERQTKLDQEDAANLQKARDVVIPDFWEGREGDLVGAAITSGLAGFFGGALAGATGGNVPPNQVLQAIQHNIDAYSQKQKEKVDNLYKYAEQKGMLNDKMRAQYAGELTDLMQQHAYLMQSAADRIGEVSDQAKGLVDQKQTDYLKAQLQGKSTELLAKAREIDTKNYDSQTHREIADADMIRANAAASKARKGKGGGGGGSAGATDWQAAMKAAAQEPGATPTSVQMAATAAGYRGKQNQLATMAKSEIGNVQKQVGDVEKQMGSLQKQLDGSGTQPGPAKQLGQLSAMNAGLQQAVASGDAGTVKASVTAITEEIGKMLSGGKTTKFTASLLDNLKSLSDEWKEHSSRILGDPAAGKTFVANVGKLMTGVAAEKRREIDEIRNPAVDALFGPGGVADSPAAKRHAMARFKQITGGVTDENGNRIYQEGGAKPPATAAGAQQHPEGATTTNRKGETLTWRGGKWQK